MAAFDASESLTPFEYGRPGHASGHGAPGEVLDDRLTISCGNGALRPTLVQRAGKGAMSAEELLRGFPILEGTSLT